MTALRILFLVYYSSIGIGNREGSPEAAVFVSYFYAEVEKTYANL